MKRILVVDDEADICWALEIGLNEEGYEIAHANEGKDALSIMRNRAFDLAIIDVKLPGKNGLEVARIAKDINPDLKILIISGYHYEDDDPIQEGIQRGEYQGFISKPFELDEVLDLVKRVTKDDRSIRYKGLVRS